MPSKTVSLSVRLTNEDLAMLSELQLPGSLTPSDKIRALVKTAHRQQEGGRDYEHALKLEVERFAAAQLGLRNAQSRGRKHSEFLLRLLTWLPDANAVVLSSLDEKGPSGEELMTLEEAMTDRVQNLLLGVLGGLVAPDAHWIAGQSAAARLTALIEAAHLVERLRKPASTGELT